MAPDEWVQYKDLWTILDQHEDLSYRESDEIPTHDRAWVDDDGRLFPLRNAEPDNGNFVDQMTDHYRHGAALPINTNHMSGRQTQCTPDSEFGEYIVYSMSLLSEKYAGVCPTYCASDY